MAHRFGDLAFTPNVQDVQRELGSREHYARHASSDPQAVVLGPDERAMVASRDSFYLSTVGETGWPYVQHRGGPPGFLKALDDRTIGFADFRGNRQYVSVGNLRSNDRVALILVDYPAKRRLKMLGHARLVDAGSAEAAQLQNAGHGARVERGFIITVEAFDWNCPQHITRRFTEAEVDRVVAPLKAQIAELQRALASARDGR